MKLFVDSGNIKDIETLAAIGIIDGVTTNPTLLAKEPGDYRQNLKKICDIVNGPVSGEVTATDYAGMMREGHDIAKIHEHMVVKVPLTRDGIKACKALSTEGLRVNVTLCFSPAQALLAAKAGATFVSPFVGRLDDVGGLGGEVTVSLEHPWIGVVENRYSATTMAHVARDARPRRKPAADRDIAVTGEQRRDER